MAVLSIGFYGLKGGIFTILTGGAQRVWGPPGGFIEGNNELAVAQSDVTGVGFSIGLARGAVVVGLAATSRRVAYACIGAPVQRAEQLAAVGARGGHQILMDEGTLASGQAPTRSVTVRADDGFAAFAAE